MQTNYNIAIAKTGAFVAVDFSQLPVASQEFIVNYGLKQLFNDAHASLKAEQQAEIAQAVTRKLEALQAGTIAQRASSPRATTPKAVAWKEVLGAIAKKNKVKVSDIVALFAKKGVDAASFDTLLAYASEHNAELAKVLKAALKRAEAVAELDIEL